MERLKAVVKSPRTEWAITILIIVNAVTLGLETSPWAMANFGPALLVIDQAILAVFVLEIAARIAVHRSAFFRDPWSLFDLVIVGIALVPAAGPSRCCAPCGCFAFCG
ncbi:ion transporter [Phenylobacterium sp. J426]|uniref:ion transporter n=1 Tax=Phenylobacterium sp. J426 TaxID=2898439 RepID=UPI0021510C35|nr:ion transporter [Phenylobacterium sp. J426]